MPESWMLARLKAETHRHQITAESDRLQLIRGGAPTVPGYIAFLKRVYGFEAPVESAFAMTPDLDQVIDVRSRGQMRLLRCDLTALGVVDPAATPRCSTIVPFRSVADALGWMYMIERNTQLNGQLYRHLETHIPMQLRIAGSYLSSFDRGAGPRRWRELGEALDRFAKPPAQAERVVSAAQAAFRCQRFWYEDRLPSRVVA